MTHMDKKAWNDYIKNELQKRRAQNNDSMWRNVGIKYMGDRKLWKNMYGWEIKYYNKHFKRKKLDG